MDSNQEKALKMAFIIHCMWVILYIFYFIFFIIKVSRGNLKFVTLKRPTPDKFDQFLEDNFLTGRAISMTLCMKIIVTIVLVLRYLPFFHII
jgi:hypothetical protein